MSATLADLMTAETRATIYAKGLAIATAVGLNVTSWVTGDPTRSYYHHIAESLSFLEQRIVSFIAAGFLDFAGATEPASTWLVLLAAQVYGYTAREATYASASACVTLTNGGGGQYPLPAGRLRVKNSSTGATYHNTSDGILLSGVGQTATFDMVADVAGSDSSSGVGEIDELVTTLPLVTCANTVALIGADAESAASIVAGCRAKLGALSPNGPWDAYVYVATSAALTGTTGITKARSFGDSDTGDVLVYVAGPSGAVAGADVTAADTAIDTWATPVCVSVTVASATGLTQAITYTKKLRAGVGKTVAEIKADDEVALEALFAAHPIGGDTGGILAHSLIEATLQKAHAAHCYSVSVATPAADVALAESQVAVLGAITATVTVDP